MIDPVPFGVGFVLGGMGAGVFTLLSVACRLPWLHFTLFVGSAMWLYAAVAYHPCFQPLSDEFLPLLFVSSGLGGVGFGMATVNTAVFLVRPKTILALCRFVWRYPGIPLGVGLLWHLAKEF